MYPVQNQYECIYAVYSFEMASRSVSMAKKTTVHFLETVNVSKFCAEYSNHIKEEIFDKEKQLHLIARLISQV